MEAAGRPRVVTGRHQAKIQRAAETAPLVVMEAAIPLAKTTTETMNRQTRIVGVEHFPAMTEAELRRVTIAGAIRRMMGMGTKTSHPSHPSHPIHLTQLPAEPESCSQQEHGR